MGSFSKGAWNFAFVGCKGAPASHCNGDGGAVPASTVDQTPLMAEKPYIVMDGSKFNLMIPHYETNKVGSTAENNWENAETVDFSNVYVGSASDSASTINGKLNEGLHVILQPGIYHLDAAITVNKANQVLLGMGMATLVSTNGNACIEVGDVDGVRIAGVIL